MKAVIMQPTYLPWIGYFDLMDQSDIFVFLDDVQFSKQSWQQKNKIKTPQGQLLLTIPIVRRHPQKIYDVEINNSQPWQSVHLRSIRYNYSKAKYFDRYIKDLEKFYFKKVTKLTEFTVPIILWIKDILGIECQFINASELDVKGSKVELLIDICHKIRADEYLSPARAKEYINTNNLFAKENIKLKYHQYNHPEYSQLWGEFVPYLSVIDLLFNQGDKSLSIIRKGAKNKIIAK